MLLKQLARDCLAYESSARPDMPEVLARLQAIEKDILASSDIDAYHVGSIRQSKDIRPGAAPRIPSFQSHFSEFSLSQAESLPKSAQSEHSEFADAMSALSDVQIEDRSFESAVKQTPEEKVQMDEPLEEDKALSTVIVRHKKPASRPSLFKAFEDQAPPNNDSEAARHLRDIKNRSMPPQVCHRFSAYRLIGPQKNRTTTSVESSGYFLAPLWGIGLLTCVLCGDSSNRRLICSLGDAMFVRKGWASGL